MAHLLGDIHQPLHVGAIYLNADGQKVNPVTSEEAEQDNTAGGNLLLVTSKENLHHKWDTTHFLDGDKLDSLIVDALKIDEPVNKNLKNLAPLWATETLQKAKLAYVDITFSSFDKDKKSWIATIPNSKIYYKTMHEVQESQMALAGARLAEILVAIFP